MNEEFLSMLDEELKGELEALNSLEFGSKEHTEAINNLATLYKLRIEDSKAAIEWSKEVDNDQFRREELEKAQQSQRTQVFEQRVDRVVKLGTTLTELILPIVFYNVWMNKGFKFEETGSFTSTTFRGLINKFRPTKK